MKDKRLLVAVVCFVAAAAGTWLFLGRRKSPPLSEAVLAEAVSRWEKLGLGGYEMEIAIGGREPRRHVVTVDNGKVIKMTTDGSPAPQRVWEFWSVDGMFRVLDEELANARSPEAAFGVSERSQVYLDASFDPGTGAPMHYLRQVAGAPKLMVEWRIERFQVR